VSGGRPGSPVVGWGLNGRRGDPPLVGIRPTRTGIYAAFSGASSGQWAPSASGQVRRATAAQPYSLSRTSTSVKPASFSLVGSVVGSIGW